MGYKITFIDDNNYTAQDVNEAFSHIASGGTSTFAFTGNVLEDLNDGVSEFASSGLTPGNSCKVVLSGTTYKISPGTCFMSDGAQITFDSSGYSIEITSGVINYVYLERDTIGNTINIQVSTTQGASGTIPLATINSDGTITDTRQFATANVSLAAQPHPVYYTGHITLQTYKTKTINVNVSNFRYFVLIYGESTTTNTYMNIYDLNLGRVLISKGERVGYLTKNGSSLLFETTWNSLDDDFMLI